MCLLLLICVTHWLSFFIDLHNKLKKMNAWYVNEKRVGGRSFSAFGTHAAYTLLE